MKLNYTFELMEMDDEIVAVPVGENAGKFKGILKMNESAEFIFNRLCMNKSKTEIANDLINTYDMSLDEANQYIDYVTDTLYKQGIFA